jgi:1,2-phenylacetyl-CoA epoxidase PaaB subunit
MLRKPEPPPLLSFDVYKIASKAVWLGSVQAPDNAMAIEKAAEEFRIDARRLYVVRRR